MALRLRFVLSYLLSSEKIKFDYIKNKRMKYIYYIYKWKTIPNGKLN